MDRFSNDNIMIVTIAHTDLKTDFDQCLSSRLRTARLCCKKN